GPVEKGFHRVAWDLRFPPTDAVGADDASEDEGDYRRGVLAAPGAYTVTLSQEVDGTVTTLSEPVSFVVERLRAGALEGVGDENAAAFWRRVAELQRSASAASVVLSNTLERVDAMRVALSRTPAAPGDLDKQLYELRQTLLDFDERLNGNRSKRQIGEKVNPTIYSRLRFAMGSTRNSTYGPTPNIQKSFDIADAEFAELKTVLQNIVDRRLPEVERALNRAGAPWVEGQPLPK
ncbi:MAG: glycosyl hydrolase, partial [bacterium]